MNILPFRKIEGCGNSFVICQQQDLAALGVLPKIEQVSKRICSLGRGVGADGFFAVGEGSAGVVPVWMHNPDGSSMGMCGNGVRCVVRYIALEERLDAEEGTINFDISGRLIQCSYTDWGRSVLVNMGVPSDIPAHVPHKASAVLLNTPHLVQNALLPISAVSMGNPHCVILVDNVDSIALEALGPAIELDPLFPERTNVEFVQVISPQEIKVRVWERGAGATLACGTGACASVVVAQKLGLVGSKVLVLLPGGNLEISWEGGNSGVFLKGPAQEICEGVIAPHFVEKEYL